MLVLIPSLIHQVLNVACLNNVIKIQTTPLQLGNQHSLASRLKPCDRYFQWMSANPARLMQDCSPLYLLWIISLLGSVDSPYFNYAYDTLWLTLMRNLMILCVTPICYESTDQQFNQGSTSIPNWCDLMRRQKELMVNLTRRVKVPHKLRESALQEMTPADSLWLSR